MAKRGRPPKANPEPQPIKLQRFRSEGPYKLDDALTKKIVGYINMGIALDIAARACGVSRTQLHEWLSLAHKGKQPYKDFLAAVDAAVAQSEINLATHIERSVLEKVWQAAAWKLERRFPQRWGRQDRAVIQQGISEGLDVVLDFLQNRLPKEVYEHVVRALADFEESPQPEAAVAKVADTEH